MHDIAQMRQSDSILILSAAGAIGQCAIQLAKTRGAEIFVTVSSEAKKQMLQDAYGILEDHIFYSRNPHFAETANSLTGGQGVDVVLNTSSKHTLSASMDCIAPFGRLIDISRKDNIMGSSLPASVLNNNVTISIVDYVALQKSRQQAIRPILEELAKMAEGDIIKPPTPFTIHGFGGILSCLKSLQDRNGSMGKQVIELRPEEEIAVRPSFTSF